LPRLDAFTLLLRDGRRVPGRRAMQGNEGHERHLMAANPIYLVMDAGTPVAAFTARPEIHDADKRDGAFYCLHFRHRNRDSRSLVHEVLSRNLRDRSAVARYAGLTGSPDESGSRRREKGLARAGNVRVRRALTLDLARRPTSPPVEH
jgi:hypothetical protein